MSDRGIIEIRFMGASNTVAAVKAFRHATNLTIADIRESFARNTPIVAAQLYGRDHEETERRLLALLHELDDLSAEYDIIVDGNTESREYLQNILQSWRDVHLETQMMTNLENGEPDIETLEWLQRESPADVFRITLEQIISDCSYTVDAETMAWVKHQLGH